MIFRLNCKLLYFVKSFSIVDNRRTINKIYVRVSKLLLGTLYLNVNNRISILKAFQHNSSKFKLS